MDDFTLAAIGEFPFIVQALKILGLVLGGVFLGWVLCERRRNKNMGARSRRLLAAYEKDLGVLKSWLEQNMKTLEECVRCLGNDHAPVMGQGQAPAMIFKEYGPQLILLLSELRWATAVLAHQAVDACSRHYADLSEYRKEYIHSEEARSAFRGALERAIFATAQAIRLLDQARLTDAQIKSAKKGEIQLERREELDRRMEQRIFELLGEGRNRPQPV